MDVSVVIVSYNTQALLAACVDSVFDREPDGLSVEVIVVDNASSDDSVAFLREHYGERITVVASETNDGFAAGNNLGFEVAQGRHVLLLNSDARLEGDVLARMVQFS